MKTWSDNPNPLVAAYDGSKTSFALFSEVNEKVELQPRVRVSGDLDE